MHAMTIYDWTTTMKYAGYAGVSESDDRKIWWTDELIGDPLPTLENWNSPHMTQYLGGGKRKRKPAIIGDAPSASSAHLISHKAAEALRDIWERDAILYPVILEDSADRYYMVVAKYIIDCLDRENSTGPRHTYGPTPELFASVEEWVFDESALGEHDLFRLPDSKTTYYLTERFKQRVIDAGLKGFCLNQRAWEDKPFVS